MDAYDRTIECYDEPHRPVECCKLFVDYPRAPRRIFLHEKLMHSLCLLCKRIDGFFNGVCRILEVVPGGKIVQTL